MKTLTTKSDPTSSGYLKNKEINLELLDQLRTRLGSVTLGGPEKARDKHQSRNKLLVRDRINLLLDPNTPFLELSPLAANGQYKNQFPSAGLVTGIGLMQP